MLNRTEGWSAPSERDWHHLWRDNPALEGATAISRGWVLVNGDAVVGVVNNVAQAYVLEERRLVAATAAAMIVARDFRGSSLQLLAAFNKQPNVDLLLNTTAAPQVSKISEFLKFKRIPQPGYHQSFYWVLRPVPFAMAALRKKGVPAPVSAVGALAAPALWAEGLVRVRRFAKAAARFELRTIRPESAGADFDDLWKRTTKESRSLLAVRDAKTLRWHFAGRGRSNPPVLVGAYLGSRLAGYAAIVRQDASHIGLRRARLADLFVEKDDPNTIGALLAGAVDEARRGGAAMLEAVGFHARVRQIFAQTRPFELWDEGWPFLFKAGDPALQSALSDESRWRACLFDGDGSL